MTEDAKEERAAIGGPVVRIADLVIAPDDLDRYKALLTEEIEASVDSEAGVLALQAVSAKADPTRIRILEIYADQAAYEAHLTTTHFLKYKTLTAGMVRSLDLVEVEPVAVRAKSPFPSF